MSQHVTITPTKDGTWAVRAVGEYAARLLTASGIGAATSPLADLPRVIAPVIAAGVPVRVGAANGGSAPLPVVRHADAKPWYFVVIRDFEQNQAFGRSFGKRDGAWLECGDWSLGEADLVKALPSMARRGLCLEIRAA